MLSSLLFYKVLLLFFFPLGKQLNIYAVSNYISYPTFWGRVEGEERLECLLALLGVHGSSLYLQPHRDVIWFELFLRLTVRFHPLLLLGSSVGEEWLGCLLAVLHRGTWFESTHSITKMWWFKLPLRLTIRYHSLGLTKVEHLPYSGLG